MRYDTEGHLLSKVSGKQTRLLQASDSNTSRAIFDLRTGRLVDWETTIAKNVGFKEDQVGNKLTGSYHLYSGNNYLGEASKTGQNNIKAQHFSAPEKSDATTVARHQVAAGQDLKSIAKLFYGNESLWYIIADANGVGLTTELREGTLLDIPARANNVNGHDNFKPINLAEIIGSTDPSMPYVPPPPQAGCNAVASMIMIAVAVAVTGGLAGALAASTSLSSFAVGAIAGAAGSVASQAVGMAMGAVDKFSWGQVAVAAITGGAA